MAKSKQYPVIEVQTVKKRESTSTSLVNTQLPGVRNLVKAEFSMPLLATMSPLIGITVLSITTYVVYNMP